MYLHILWNLSGLTRSYGNRSLREHLMAWGAKWPSSIFAVSPTFLRCLFTAFSEDSVVMTSLEKVQEKNGRFTRLNLYRFLMKKTDKNASQSRHSQFQADIFWWYILITQHDDLNLSLLEEWKTHIYPSVCVWPLNEYTYGEAIVKEEDTDTGQLGDFAGFHGLHATIPQDLNHNGPAPEPLLPLHKDHGAWRGEEEQRLNHKSL